MFSQDSGSPTWSISIRLKDRLNGWWGSALRVIQVDTILGRPSVGVTSATEVAPHPENLSRLKWWMVGLMWERILKLLPLNGYFKIYDLLLKWLMVVNGDTTHTLTSPLRTGKLDGFCYKNSKDWLNWARKAGFSYRTWDLLIRDRKNWLWVRRAGEGFLRGKDGINIGTEAKEYKTCSVTHLVLTTGSCRETVVDATGKIDLGLSHWREILTPAQESGFLLKAQGNTEIFCACK